MWGATVSRRDEQGGFTLVELVVVIGLIGVLISLLLPAVQSVREAARRTQCASQMGQIALGVLAYESAHEVLPPGSVNPTGPIVNTTAGYHYSWIAQVLPHLDQPALHASLNFDLGVYDAANATAAARSLRVLLCPSNPGAIAGSSPARSHYVGNHHHDEAPIQTTNSGLLFLNSAVRLDEVPDGRGPTILFGERRPSLFEPGWASGTRATLRNGGHALNAPDPTPTPAVPDPVGGFGSYHPGGVNFVYADGRVSFFKATASRTGVLQPLLNRADGQAIDEAWLW